MMDVLEGAIWFVLFGLLILVIVGAVWTFAVKAGLKDRD